MFDWEASTLTWIIQHFAQFCNSPKILYTSNAQMSYFPKLLYVLIFFRKLGHFNVIFDVQRNHAWLSNNTLRTWVVENVNYEYFYVVTGKFAPKSAVAQKYGLHLKNDHDSRFYLRILDLAREICRSFYCGPAWKDHRFQNICFRKVFVVPRFHRRDGLSSHPFFEVS